MPSTGGYGKKSADPTVVVAIHGDHPAVLFTASSKRNANADAPSTLSAGTKCRTAARGRHGPRSTTASAPSATAEASASTVRRQDGGRPAVRSWRLGAATVARSLAPPEQSWHRRCTHSGCGRELGPHQRRPAAGDNLPLLGQSRDGRRARHRNAGLVLGPPPVSARPRQDRRSELAATTPSASSNTRRVSSMSASV